MFSERMMVNSLDLEKDKKWIITKLNTPGLFLNYKKEIDDGTTKSKRNLFKLKTENKVMKDRIIRDITNLFEQEEDYYIRVRVGTFCNNNFIEYESNGDINKNLSITEYLDKIKTCLKYIINDVNKSDTLKIQLIVKLLLLKILIKSV